MTEEQLKECMERVALLHARNLEVAYRAYLANLRTVAISAVAGGLSDDAIRSAREVSDIAFGQAMKTMTATLIGTPGHGETLH